MKFGLLLPQTNWVGSTSAIRDVAQAAEALGFDAVSVHDHIQYNGWFIASGSQGTVPGATNAILDACWCPCGSRRDRQAGGPSIVVGGPPGRGHRRRPAAQGIRGETTRLVRLSLSGAGAPWFKPRLVDGSTTRGTAAARPSRSLPQMPGVVSTRTRLRARRSWNSPDTWVCPAAQWQRWSLGSRADPRTPQVDVRSPICRSSPR
jgi:hypothetical protein